MAFDSVSSRPRRRWPVSSSFILAILLGCFLFWPPAVSAESPPTTAEQSDSTATVAADAAVERDAWFVTTIAGAPVGSVHERVLRAGAGAVSELENVLVLNRMGSQVEMISRALQREDGAGRLVAVELTMDMSSRATSYRAEVVRTAAGTDVVAAGGEVRIVDRTAAGGSATRSVPFDGELIGPEEARRRTVAALREPGDAVSYQLFVPELGGVTTVTRTLVAREEIVAAGFSSPVAALKVRETMTAMPIASLLWLDGEGRLLRMEQPGPFGQMAVIAADAAAARLAAAGNELPEESYGASLVSTQIRLPRPRRLEWLELELRHRNPELGWPELAGPGQRVVEQRPDRLVLAIDRPVPPAGLPFPVELSAERRRELAEYLEPNAYIRSDDPALMAVAAEIAGSVGDSDDHGPADLMTVAGAIERWVAEAMSFDMGVVLAPSDEVLAERKGTCTEYAMLLTALTRAAGIPSRFAMGYVYVNGIFGGHAWTEILAGDVWVPLDAAVITAGAADAGRFAFIRSSLADGVGRLSVGPAMQLYGQLDLSVTGYRLAGGPAQRVAADAPLYTVDGDRFASPSLGVALTLPEGFSFTDLTATWPAATVVGVGGPDGRSGRLEGLPLPYWRRPEAAAWEVLLARLPGGERHSVEVAGRRAAVVATDERAALALPDGDTLWLLSTEGPDARELLDRLASGLEIEGWKIDGWEISSYDPGR